jgi:hypothetical protein
MIRFLVQHNGDGPALFFVKRLELPQGPPNKFEALHRFNEKIQIRLVTFPAGFSVRFPILAPLALHAVGQYCYFSPDEPPSVRCG